MKKLIIVLIIPIIFFFIFIKKDYFSSSKSLLSSPSPSPSPRSLDTLVFNHHSYTYAFTIIKNSQHLNLYPNFSNQLTSSQILDQYHCQVLVSAGFYSQTNQPLGWLVSQGKLVSSAVKNSLFNGYLNLDQQLLIGSNPVQPLPRLGLQSGPLLILDQQPLSLKINNDQFRRRLVAAQTQSGFLVFLIILQPDSTFSGPLLADLPRIIKAIDQQQQLQIENALNLDGGTASVFFTPSVFLKELSLIGSFFCLQP